MTDSKTEPPIHWATKTHPTIPAKATQIACGRKRVRIWTMNKWFGETRDGRCKTCWGAWVAQETA